ncbi:Arm DNA-binding domain-containing protein [Pantoea agglomerans]|nr:Arm DNA-binding domain-containing protein [Pantoea agglomerans]MBD8130095.1 DUF4102 domain-containing protein [Pantoea agglomerans]
MAVNDAKVHSAKSEAKAYKLIDDENVALLVHPNGFKYWQLRYVDDSQRA